MLLAQGTLLRAAPMSDQQQVEVLQLVTQMAALVREQKAEIAALRGDVSKHFADEKARLGDFERRINLAEARGAIRAAMASDAPAPSNTEASPAPVLQPVGARLVPAMATAAPAPVVASAPKRYRVQAASPGLALLAEVARGGGDGAQIQVAVGDTIPGWGVVKSGVQKGPNWVVNTEHGPIE